MVKLVLDCGHSCVGILSVEDGGFRVFGLGQEMAEAVKQIQAADEIITYNGKNFDLPLLAKFMNLSGTLPINGVHSDMRTIRWSDEIWGSNLISTYREYFPSLPTVPDTYEGSIEQDCLMALGLWKLWKAGQLRGAAS